MIILSSQSSGISSSSSSSSFCMFTTSAAMFPSCYLSSIISISTIGRSWETFSSTANLSDYSKFSKGNGFIFRVCFSFSSSDSSSSSSSFNTKLILWENNVEKEVGCDHLHLIQEPTCTIMIHGIRRLGTVTIGFLRIWQKNFVDKHKTDIKCKVSIMITNDLRWIPLIIDVKVVWVAIYAVRAKVLIGFGISQSYRSCSCLQDLASVKWRLPQDL